MADRRISAHDISSQPSQPQHQRCDCCLHPHAGLGIPSLPSCLILCSTAGYRHHQQHTHTHGIPWAAISSDPLPSPCVPGPSACSGHCQRALLSSCQPHCLTLATAMLCMGLVALPSFIFPVQQVSECQAFPTPVTHSTSILKAPPVQFYSTLYHGDLF